MKLRLLLLLSLVGALQAAGPWVLWEDDQADTVARFFSSTNRNAPRAQWAQIPAHNYVMNISPGWIHYGATLQLPTAGVNYVFGINSNRFGWSPDSDIVAVTNSAAPIFTAPAGWTTYKVSEDAYLLTRAPLLPSVLPPR